MNIGVFDSGLGGLSIFRELTTALPRYNYIYLGDNARTPYGNRSPRIVYEYTKEALRFLIGKKCSLIILGCNTASTVLRPIQKDFLKKQYPHVKVLGVVRPAIEEALALPIGRIGVIGTTTTIGSKAFVKEIQKNAPDVKIYQQACPLLVPIIEEGELEWEGVPLILQKYLKKLKAHHIEKLILGCTHYSLIEKSIQKEVGQRVKIINEGKAVARKLKTYLARHPDIETSLDRTNNREYYVTDLNVHYRRLFKLFLGHRTKPARIILINLK